MLPASYTIINTKKEARELLQKLHADFKSRYTQFITLYTERRIRLLLSGFYHRKMVKKETSAEPPAIIFLSRLERDVCRRNDKAEQRVMMLARFSL